MAPGGKAYRTMRWLLQTFSHKMTCNWKVPFDGEPCVFVPNHVGVFGPLIWWPSSLIMKNAGPGSMRM